MSRLELKKVIRMIEAANKEVPVETQFLNDLETTIEMNSRLEREKPSQTYKPSSMNCTRQMVYQVLGYDLDESSESYQFAGICESGTDRHVRIQKAIESMKNCAFIDVAEFVKQRGLDYLEIKGQRGMECKLYHKDLNMSFMCDGIIRYKSNYYIFEFKTETSDKFYNRRDVDASHCNQATAYSLAFGIDNVLFVYENRNTLDKKAFIKHVTEEERQTLISRINYCQSYVETKKIPPKPEDVPKKTCNYCEYKSQCGKDS